MSEGPIKRSARIMCRDVKMRQLLGDVSFVAPTSKNLSAIHRHLRRLGLSREYAVIMREAAGLVQYVLFIG